MSTSPERALDHPLTADAATVHLVFEPAHGRAGEVPGEAGPRRTAAYDFVGEEGVEVVHGIDLRRRGIGPAEAERAEPAFHLAEHVMCLLTHGVGRGFAMPYSAFAVACTALLRLAAARDHEARRGVGGGDGEGERVERGLRRRVDLRAHIAA